MTTTIISDGKKLTFACPKHGSDVDVKYETLKIREGMIEVIGAKCIQCGALCRSMWTNMRRQK